MHPCPGNLVAIRRAVVYYARAALAFSAEFNVGIVVIVLAFTLSPRFLQMNFIGSLLYYWL